MLLLLLLLQFVARVRSGDDVLEEIPDDEDWDELSCSWWLWLL